MPTSNRTWSAYESRICHYCGEHAGTVDHIVPRSAFNKPQAALPHWFRSHNIVPACRNCNGKKANYRSDCACEVCTWAWNVATACFLPLDYKIRGIIKVVRSPG